MASGRSPLLRSFVTALAVASGGMIFAPACGSEGNGNGSASGNDGGDLDGAIGNPFAEAGKGNCKGLACQVEDCGQNASTTLTGTVFAPNGTLPLYNAVVFVPNAPLDPIPEGPSCDHCGNVSGEPITATLTDTSGRFTLKKVPSGADIPLVIQVGKWRREVKIPNVDKCVETKVDKELTRLPKKQSEGHIPKMAISTGLCDSLACLMPKLGLDPSEFTHNTGVGRLDLYRGAYETTQNKPAPAPTGSPAATELWKDLDSLKRYDMVILSCECDEHNETKSDASKKALYEYAKLGGRVFASHFHYTWFQKSPLPEPKSVAEWVGGSPNGTATGGFEEPFLVDQSFPKGQAMAEWLVNVAATTVKGQVPVAQPKADVVGVDTTKATRWIYNTPAGQKETTKYLSFNAPIGAPADQQCGKTVFGDLHITRPESNPNGGVATNLPDDNFPASCPSTLTPEEKALIFLFFDLSSCIQKEDEPPPIPLK